MTFSNMLSDLNNKRLTVTLQLANTNTTCSIFCNHARVFLKNNKREDTRHLTFLNEDWEEISIDADTIKSISKLNNVYTFACSDCSIIAE